MPYLRQRQRLAANERVGVRFNLEQRDRLLRSPHLPREIAHRLHRAPVKKGKLEIRLGRDSLDAVILAAANLPEDASPTAKLSARRADAIFLRYLENLADRFEEAEDISETDDHLPTDGDETPGPIIGIRV